MRWFHNGTLAFLEEFGADIGRPVIFKDVTDEPLTIDEALFLDKTDKTLKSDKQGRGKYMKLLALSVKEADEIWLRWETEFSTGKQVLKRRYIKLFENTDGSHCLTVFEKGKNGWSGSTTFPAYADRGEEARKMYVNQYRDGFLAYKK